MNEDRRGRGRGDAAAGPPAPGVAFGAPASVKLQILCLALSDLRSELPTAMMGHAIAGGWDGQVRRVRVFGVAECLPA